MIVRDDFATSGEVSHLMISGLHTSFINKRFGSSRIPLVTTGRHSFRSSTQLSSRKRSINHDRSILWLMPHTSENAWMTLPGVSFFFVMPMQRRTCGGSMWRRNGVRIIMKADCFLNNSDIPSSQWPAMASAGISLYFRVFHSRCVTSIWRWLWHAGRHSDPRPLLGKYCLPSFARWHTQQRRSSQIASTTSMYDMQSSWTRRPIIPKVAGHTPMMGYAVHTSRWCIGMTICSPVTVMARYRTPQIRVTGISRTSKTLCAYTEDYTKYSNRKYWMRSSWSPRSLRNGRKSEYKNTGRKAGVLGIISRFMDQNLNDYILMGLKHIRGLYEST